MGWSSFPTWWRALGGVAAAVLSVGLAGCPNAAHLENEQRFEALDAGADATGDGDCAQELPSEATVGCAYLGMLQGSTGHCATGGCHNASISPSAGLNLHADPFLTSRILNVFATHKVSCGVGMPCNLDAPNCAACMDCPEGDYLLSKARVDESWIMKKMDTFDVTNPSTPVEMGCGTSMPYLPRNNGFTAERRQCLKDFFRWIAENGRPCTIMDGGADGGAAADGG